MNALGMSGWCDLRLHQYRSADIGEIGETIPLYYLPTYIFLFYSPLQGPKLLSSYMVGLALFLGTIIQAISNPIIGHHNDSKRHPI